MKEHVYLVEIEKPNKKYAKYVISGFSDMYHTKTTNSLKLATKFKDIFAATSAVQDFQKTNNIKAKLTDIEYDLIESEQINIAEKCLKEYSMKHRQSPKYEPKLMVVCNALYKHYHGLEPIISSTQDYTCPSCGSLINFDALSQNYKEAPSFCRDCGQRFDWKEFFKTAEHL